MNRTRELMEAVGGIGYDDLTEGDLGAVRTLLLDHLGVAASGSTTDSAVSFRRTMERVGYSAAATAPVVGTGQSAPAAVAAMANAVAGHSIEYDDVHNASSSHPGVVIFPAVLAAAALSGAGERELVRGAAVGYEVMCRAGRAADPPAHYGRHFHPTGTIGALGAAAGAAAVLGLDAGGLASAVGIAGSMASGSMQFLVDGAWTKRLHPALAARSGVEAALLAADGYRGTEDGIAGERGFLAAYSGAPRPERLMEGWGEWPLEVAVTSVKAHTCCRYNQGPIDALLAIRSAHGLSGDEVDDVLIGVPSVAVDIVAEPAEAKRRPRSVVDAQFSLHYGAAVALMRGQAGLAEYCDEALEDKEVLEVADRVRYEVDPEIDRVYPERWRAWARVAAGGGDFYAETDEPKGDPGNPLTPVEIRGKFDSLAACVYDEAARRSIAEHALTMGEPGSLAGLNEALAGASA